MLNFCNNFILIFAVGILLIMTYQYFVKIMNTSKVMALVMTSSLMAICLISLLGLLEKFGFNSYSMTILCFIYILFIITVHDFKEKFIPTNWLVLGIIMGLILLVNNPNMKMLEGITGSVIMCVTLLVFSKITKGGIGRGDAYVFALISLLIGWRMASTIFVLSIMLSGLLGIILYVLRRVNKKDSMPFIPFVMVVTLIIIWV